MTIIPAWAFGALAAAAVLTVARVVTHRRRTRAYVDRAFDLVRAGHPGRARALLRVAARTKRPDARALLCEAYRSSYGCSDTRSFTEYGERVFRDHLAHGEPFVTALTRANDDTLNAETARNATLSHPRLSVGNASSTKLGELEERLDLR